MIYILVENTKPQLLVDEVNENIGKGFIPIGGISNDRYGYYVQAMTNETPEKVYSKSFMVMDKGIVPGETGPEYVFTYQYQGKEHSVNIGKGLRNYTDEELKIIALGE